MLGAGQIVFYLSCTKWSVLKNIHKITLYGLSRLHFKMHVCIHIHVCVITMEKEVMNLQESVEGYMEAFGRRKGKGEIL